MEAKIGGIHHITAIAGDPQKNIDFYAGILGLRMVKKTINFDDPQTYHFYFGHEAGHPGTLITFFPWGTAGLRGQPGLGQVTSVAFAIPERSVNFWIERLKKYEISFEGPYQRFDEEVIAFSDPDGIRLELVNAGPDSRPGWPAGPVPGQHALRGFFNAVLTEEGYERTPGLLTETMGFRLKWESGNQFRYEAASKEPGKTVDIVCHPHSSHGRVGVGAVHHIAWRVPDDEAQKAYRERLVELGYNVTPVIDRNYFHSIYFREPGGVLFEIATDPPGFAVDESPENLGSKLMLPPWLESRRSELENLLPSIHLPESKKGADR